MRIINSSYYTFQIPKKKESTVKTQKEFKNINLNSNPIANINHANISFGVMRKSQFKGIDLMMVNQLQAPIEKFWFNRDFQKYCQDILDKNYTDKKSINSLCASRKHETTCQRSAILNDWIYHVTSKESGYRPAVQLMILSSITKDIKFETDHLPPVLDKKKLEDVIQEIEENCKRNKAYSCNFDKLYRSRLIESILKNETQLDGDSTGWIIIPNKTKDSEHFEENVKKLQVLSQGTWCTKHYNAKSYLENDDLHIYIEKGKTKLGIRIRNGKIIEAQGVKNDGFIPFRYYNQLIAHADKNNLAFDKNLKFKINFAKSQKEFYDSIGEDAIKNKVLDKILPLYGFKVEKDENGMLIIESFIEESARKPNILSLEDLGITREDILSRTIKIKGDFKMGLNEKTSTGSIEEIDGSFDISCPKIKTLGKIKKVEGSLIAMFAEDLQSLGSLQHVGGNLELGYNSKLKTDALKLNHIGGILKFPNSTYLQPSLLLDSTPLSRPITYTEYEKWEIDKKGLTIDEIQRKINETNKD